MTKTDRPEPESGNSPTAKRGSARRTRGIRFSDSEWEEVKAAGELHDVPAAEFVRKKILDIARGRDILDRAKQAAVDYYRLTGKPLGITGEVGEYEAARLLGLTLIAARVPGYDATDDAGLRYQIKSRAVPDLGRADSQRLGSIKRAQKWDAVLMVLMNQEMETQEIWRAERKAVVKALDAPGSKARNERGALSVSKFRQIGTQVWPQAR